MGELISILVSWYVRVYAPNHLHCTTEHHTVIHPLCLNKDENILNEKMLISHREN